MLKTKSAASFVPAAAVAEGSALQDRIPGIFDAMGLDRAVVFALLGRSVGVVSGLVSLTLIARFLSRAQQGYFYTFYSLVAIQIVFELGFSTVVLQTASHEAAHLEVTETGISGIAGRHARLASVLQTAIRWYTAAGLAMAVLLYPVGYLFFRHQEALHGAMVAWRWPWAMAVSATCLTFQLDPLFSFLEGCGFVWNVQRARFAQAVGGSVLGWAALATHHGLFAPGCVIAGQALCGWVFVAGKRGLLLPLAHYRAGDAGVDWRSEVWPFQWRIAVSWLCGYLTSQLFNPILMDARGPVEAGQMGMSLSICGTLTAMAVAWMSTKAAPMGRLISLRDFRTLDRLFFRAVVQSATAAALGFGGVWVVVREMRAHQIGLALRVLPPGALGLLFVAHLVNVAVFAEALYVRAHKQEKFMVNSVLSAAWMVPVALVAGRRYGAYGIAVGYLCGAVVIGLGYGTWTFARYRRLWHGV